MSISKPFSPKRRSLGHKILTALRNQELIEWTDTVYLEKLVCITIEDFKAHDISYERERGSVSLNAFEYHSICRQPHIIIHNHPPPSAIFPSDADWDFAREWARHIHYQCQFFMIVNYCFSEAIMYKHTPHALYSFKHEKFHIPYRAPFGRLVYTGAIYDDKQLILEGLIEASIDELLEIQGLL